MTETLDKFISDHLNRYVYYPGVPGVQCVALSQAYVRDVWGLPHTWGNAIDIFGEMPDRIQWERNIWGNPASKPRRGDLVVWHTDHYVGTGVYGHIAICVNPGDGYTFTTLDQNWPPGHVTQFVKHSYFGVTGWGRPKAVMRPTPTPTPGKGSLSGGGDQSQSWFAALLDWLARLFRLDSKR